MFSDMRRLATDSAVMLADLDRHMQSMAATMQGVHETLISIDEQTERLNRRLPGVQRGFELLEPLEGTVERVGRIVDRLPRWISGEPKRDVPAVMSARMAPGATGDGVSPT